MFQFVYWLKALAAVSITNAHYAEIWPIASLAFGGHIGNCIYFFLSGFCLYHIHDKFPKWFAKRIIRIYPALWLVNLVDLLAGRSTLGSATAALHYFFFPTWFHFIESIMLLYILYYIIRGIQKKLRIQTLSFMLFTLVGFLFLYLFQFDKSHYHIDNVNENWVRFMFIESMLMGALFREKYDNIRQHISKWNIFSFLSLMFLYFAGKKLLTHVDALSVIQCFHPIVLILFIGSLVTLFIKLEKQGFFDRCNKRLQTAVRFVASITLEIYLGQCLILWKFSGLVFPLNFFVVTALILLYAWIIHLGAVWIQNKSSRFLHF